MNILVAEKPKILETLGISQKKFPAINRRIEMLGQMDDRHKEALGAGNRQALLELAAEYIMLGDHGGCPALARQITNEAENL